MRVVIAIDSFKGSMTSKQAGNAVMRGIMSACRDPEIIIKSIADGGEGTVEALVESLDGDYINLIVKNPLGREVNARYGVIDDTAVIEIAAAAGISLISREELNPMETTTYGVGEIIKDAILRGCRKFVIGIGGSATNDGGIGMLQALGYEFLDKDGNQVPFGAKGLSMISEIKSDNAMPELRKCSFNIACDVTNPLCGSNGCSAVFAPQKGAGAEDILIMDKGMEHYARLTREMYSDADPDFSGAGAAGGLGFAMMTYLNGKLQSGIDLILKQIRLEDYIKAADIVVTGEGRIDEQTVMGKAPVGVAKLAKKYNRPVIAFAGSVSDKAGICNKHGIDAIFSVIKRPCSLDEAMDFQNACRNLEDTAEQAFRLVCAGQRCFQDLR